MRQQTDSRARSCTSGSGRTMHVSRGPIHLRPHFSVRCPVSCDLIDCYELSGRAGEREHERAKVIVIVCVIAIACMIVILCVRVSVCVCV